MLLLGLMAADVVAIILLTIPVLAAGPGVRRALRDRRARHGRVHRATGRCGGWRSPDFPYAIALKTGNPAAVNSSFILFFPFAFLTTSFLPQEALTGWMATIADYNPVTYVLAGLRSLITGWEFRTLAEGLAATLALMVVSFGLASLAMRGRVRRG